MSLRPGSAARAIVGNRSPARTSGQRTASGVKLAAGLLALHCLGLGPARAEGVGLVRTQVVDLLPGWNAVYLEVDPVESDPASLFAGTPVDVVATHAMPVTPSQFVENPSADMLKAYGWSVWYAPSRPDAFLSTLFGLYGAKPYLVHAATNASITVEGTEALRRLSWSPNAYTFTGFPVASPGGPTFAEYFAGSADHLPLRVYRLVNGTWRKVVDPSATVMRAGEACWIYTEGRSDYQGLLEVTTPSPLGVMVSDKGGSEVVFRNLAPHPISFEVEHRTDPDRPVALSVPVQALDESAPGLRTLTYNFPAGNWVQAFPTLEAGEAVRLPLDLRLREASSGAAFSTLIVRTDLGTLTYLPVIATAGETEP